MLHIIWLILKIAGILLLALAVILILLLLIVMFWDPPVGVVFPLAVEGVPLSVGLDAHEHSGLVEAVEARP